MKNRTFLEPAFIDVNGGRMNESPYELSEVRLSRSRPCGEVHVPLSIELQTRKSGLALCIPQGYSRDVETILIIVIILILLGGGGFYWRGRR